MNVNSDPICRIWHWRAHASPVESICDTPDNGKAKCRSWLSIIFMRIMRDIPAASTFPDSNRVNLSMSYQFTAH